MKTRTDKELAMLKRLEHLYVILKHKRRITSREILLDTGLEVKYWRKIIDGGLVEKTGSNNKPYYEWVANIQPNIHMAKEILRDYSNMTEDNIRMIIAKELVPSKDWIIEKKDINRDGSDMYTIIPVGTNSPVGISGYFDSEEKAMRFMYYLKESVELLESTDPTEEYWENLAKDKYNEFMKIECAERLADHPYFNKPIDTNIPFSKFWDLYDYKKGDKTKIEKVWNKLSNEVREKIMKHIPLYKEATPDKVYRKHPTTYLNNKGWEDEIINKTYIKPAMKSNFTNSLSQYSDIQLWEELVSRGYKIDGSRLIKELTK